MGARNWYFSVMIGVSRGDSLASESDGYFQSLNEYKYQQPGKSNISLQMWLFVIQKAWTIVIAVKEHAAIALNLHPPCIV